MAYYEGDISGLTTGNNSNGNGMFGGDGWWAIIIFALIFGWGGNGFGNRGGGGGSEGTTINVDSALQRGFDTSSIMTKLDGIGNGICDSTYALNNSITTGFANTNVAVMQNGYETRNAINTLGYNVQDCCCKTQNSLCQLGNSIGTQIADVNYNLANQFATLNYNLAKSTCDTIQAGKDNTQRIIDYLTGEKISSLQADNAAIRSQLSQANQTSNIINALRPSPVPAYVVTNPNCCATGCSGVAIQ